MIDGAHQSYGVLMSSPVDSHKHDTSIASVANIWHISQAHVSTIGGAGTCIDHRSYMHLSLCSPCVSSTCPFSPSACSVASIALSPLSLTCWTPKRPKAPHDDPRYETPPIRRQDVLVASKRWVAPAPCYSQFRPMIEYTYILILSCILDAYGRWQQLQINGSTSMVFDWRTCRIDARYSNADSSLVVYR
jgi:hypothetical protein